MRSSLDAFRRRSTDWGLRRAIYWTFTHALARLGCRVHYVVITSGRDDLEDPDPPAIPPGYTVRKVIHDDLLPYAETHNYPSLLHGYEHPNFRSLFMGYVGWITLFGRQIPINSRHAKRIGFEFVRKSVTGVRQYVR